MAYAVGCCVVVVIIRVAVVDPNNTLLGKLRESHNYHPQACGVTRMKGILIFNYDAMNDITLYAHS